ncbi:MAG TPA: phosphotransferase [Caulobacteraceae bacterium]|jgi:hypothetical protein
MPTLLDILPSDRRDAAAAALAQAFGGAPLTAASAVSGGVSALTYRLEVGGRAYALRLESQRPGQRDPSSSYACLVLAAAAGVAPPVRYADAPTGIAILDFVQPVPLEQFPGGAEALAGNLGRLIGQLQAIADYPTFSDYRSLLRRMLTFIACAGVFAPGLLTPHLEAFERLQAAYPWDAEPALASHNDPNLRNVLFDGRRLWLIDWETAYRNDPLVDVSILANELGSADAALVAAWRPAAAGQAARLMLMRQFVRLYYACLIFVRFAFAPPATPDTDLAAPSVDEFRAMVTDGRLAMGSPELVFTLGKMHLAAFLAYARGPLVAAALKELGAT